jgi:hypothetical protein
MADDKDKKEDKKDDKNDDKKESKDEDNKSDKGDDKKSDKGDDNKSDKGDDDKKDEVKKKVHKPEDRKKLDKAVERLSHFNDHDPLSSIKSMKNTEMNVNVETDNEVVNSKTKVETDNALLVITEMKLRAQNEVIELKKLLKVRGDKIYELEQENKRLMNRNRDLEDMMSGAPPRARQSQHEHIPEPMRSQDGEGFERAQDQPVYDQPPSQDDEDDFWQEGKAAKAPYGGNDNDLWIMGNKEALAGSNMNAYNTPGGIAGKSQGPGYGKSLPKRPQGVDQNDDMAFYGVGGTSAKRR